MSGSVWDRVDVILGSVWCQLVISLGLVLKPLPWITKPPPVDKPPPHSYGEAAPYGLSAVPEWHVELSTWREIFVTIAFATQSEAGVNRLIQQMTSIAPSMHNKFILASSLIEAPAYKTCALSQDATYTLPQNLFSQHWQWVPFAPKANTWGQDWAKI